MGERRELGKLRALKHLWDRGRSSRIVMRPRTEDGIKKRGLVFGVGGPSGGMSKLPGSEWGAYVRRAMRPLQTPPAILYDAHGQRIGQIVVDPVTGKRTRQMD